PVNMEGVERRGRPRLKHFAQIIFAAPQFRKLDNVDAGGVSVARGDIIDRDGIRKLVAVRREPDYADGSRRLRYRQTFQTLTGLLDTEQGIALIGGGAQNCDERATNTPNILRIGNGRWRREGMAHAHGVIREEAVIYRR